MLAITKRICTVKIFQDIGVLVVLFLKPVWNDRV
ncbi:uncharacterized protein METZ01_LOCUS142154 [marine metagenome]|uniref:Uncharacterized protein n=1 Tax=marine metagenome TaxID=408172 RepID=A0A381ZJ80_9ZZZZ